MPIDVPTSRTPRAVVAAWIVLVAAAVLTNVLQWSRIAHTEEFPLASLLHDDGYYYLVIAENVLDGKGVTFDGLHPTTGFQPLYQAVTIGLTAAARSTGTSVFRWIFFFNLALTAIAALLLARTAIVVSGAPRPWLVYLLAGLLWPLNFPLVFKRLGSGMEMALAVCGVVALLCVFTSARAHDGGGRRRLAEGLLLSALTLTRMDYAIYALVFGAWLVMATRARGGAVRGEHGPLVLWGLGYAAPIVAYLAYAAVCLDSVLPVSLLAKQHYTDQLVAGMPLAARGMEFVKNLVAAWVYPLGYTLFGWYWRWGAVGLGTATALVGATAVMLAHLGRARIRRIAVHPGLLWFAAAILAHLAVFAWSGVGYLTPALFWYYAPEVVASGALLLLLAAAGTAVTGGRRQFVAAVLATVFVGSTMAYDLEADIESYAPYRRAIALAREQVPRDARIGSWDAGYNAYWLRPRTVVNLDGMVNSRDYLDRVVKTGDFGAYLSAQRIRYLINMMPETPSEDAVVQTRYFRHPTIRRDCYAILSQTPFERQHLIIYLLRYDCG